MTDAGDPNLLTDNPELYEARFPDPDHTAGRFVDDLLREHLPPTAANQPTTVLDLGCGTGRDLGFLAGRGYRCLGIDRSPRMVEFARTRYRGVSATLGDLRNFSIDETVDAVICLDSSLLYCHSDAELESCLRSCRRHIRSGGVLVAEMRNGAYFLGNTDLLDGARHSSFDWQGGTWRSETVLWIDHAAQLLRRRRTWQVPDAAGELVQTSAWRLLFPLELTGHLRRAGFTVRAMFDSPGPRTDQGWPGPEGSAGGMSEAMSGDRMHLVAEAI